MLTGGTLCSVDLCPGFKEAEASCKEEEISPESVGEEGIEERVGAGVDGVEEDQQEFSI